MEEACESSLIPAPTPPVSRVTPSQWKLLAPRWEAGSSSEKNLTTLCFLLSCHYWKVTWAQSARHSAALLAVLWVSTVVESRRAANYLVCEATHLQWLLKIPPRLKTCAVQTRHGRAGKCAGKFHNSLGVTVAVFSGFRFSQDYRLENISPGKQAYRQRSVLNNLVSPKNELQTQPATRAHVNMSAVTHHHSTHEWVYNSSPTAWGGTLTGWEEWRTKWLNVSEVRKTCDTGAARGTTVVIREKQPSGSQVFVNSWLVTW